MTKRASSPDPRPRGSAPVGEVAPEKKAVNPPPQSPLAVMREWMDALVVAFVLAMFIRVFMVELFKIPSGSMTPTLIGTDSGGRVANVDYNRDGKKDLLLFRGLDDDQPLLFLNNGQRLVAQGHVSVSPGEIKTYKRNDHILVNKLAYWFHPPRRGDVVVFKVPQQIWDPTKPIFIKRCVGEPGNKLTFDEQGHLIANGQLVSRPDFFQTQSYNLTIEPQENGFMEPEGVRYREKSLMSRTIESIQVPKDQIYVFGDNTYSSLDSRYWGGVPIDNLKGRAFFLYWPVSQMKFLQGGG
jgi:signal peptidase I